MEPDRPKSMVTPGKEGPAIDRIKARSQPPEIPMEIHLLEDPTSDQFEVDRLSLLPRISTLSLREREQLTDVERSSYNGLLKRDIDERRLQEESHIKEWCRCTCCDITTLSEPREAFCCQECDVLNTLRESHTATGHCITTCDTFRHKCLAVQTLESTAQNWAAASKRPIPKELIIGTHNR